MKKQKKPGDNISLKTKKNESPLIIEWINGQTNLMDSIRYLIENEIAANGVRNLQNYIPAERSFPMDASSFPLEKGEIAATREAYGQSKKEADIADDPSAKEVEEPPMEDDIDDDDIESWT
ncbi:hypothetical protein WD019_09785 [Fictibacillus sp. Mic-4]|uniref:hypothetical protein n=1 Tax=Fictibacillus sp. Mic-4 TaxID=3132826 RepID=UPI003CE8429A